MTSEELQLLKGMNQQQAVKHYLDKFWHGEITRDQMDQGIELWKKEVGNHAVVEVNTQNVIDMFGGHEVKEELDKCP